MKIVDAHVPERVAAIRELFAEYSNSIETDLCFQDFEKELADLPGKYHPPEGRLFLALEQDAVAGCVGLRKLDNTTCEMKRLYVRPAFRGKGIGRDLALAVIAAAGQAGYRALRHHPVEGVVFMELRLNTSRQSPSVV